MKDNDGFVDYDEKIDPSVVASISPEPPKEGKGKGKKNKPETDGRGKPGHGGQHGVDVTGRSKKTFDLSIECQGRMNEIARAEQLAQPEVVEFAVDLLYRLWKDGKIDLDQFKTVIYSDKQVWRGRNKLVLPDEFELFSE